MLRVVMYHYVRDLPRSRFPRLKAMLTADFAAQVRRLAEQYEMASLESALAFLGGEYQPSGDLCLTFDDGLHEHYSDVLPVLAEQRVQGIFGLVTSCIDRQQMAMVHKNHFLMASLDFSSYEREFRARLAELRPRVEAIDSTTACRTYRWDTPEVAAFKYLLNFQLAEPIKADILDALFARHLGDEGAFARELYLNWDQAREMQAAGMIIAGHTDRHLALSTLPETEQADDLRHCTEILHARLHPQARWPFTYPYGKRRSFTQFTIATLRELGYDCAFCTEVGDNQPGEDRFRIRRIDPKDVA